MSVKAGITGTSENTFSIGDSVDSNKYIYAETSDTNKPGLRWNESGTAWEYSNDGLAWNTFASGSVPDGTNNGDRLEWISSAWTVTTDIDLPNTGNRTIGIRATSGGTNGRSLTISGGAVSAGSDDTGGGLTLKGASGGTTNGPGGTILVLGGGGVGSGIGGSATIQGGAQGGTGDGGVATLSGGAASGASGDGGDAIVTAGDSVSGTAGDVRIGENTTTYVAIGGVAATCDMRFTPGSNAIVVGQGQASGFTIGDGSNASTIALSATGLVNSDWTFSASGGGRNLTSAQSAGATAGTALTVQAGQGGPTDATGGATSIYGGSGGGTNGAGGLVGLYGGAGAGTGDGGDLIIRAGDAVGSGTDGNIFIGNAATTRILFGATSDSEQTLWANSNATEANCAGIRYDDTANNRWEVRADSGSWLPIATGTSMPASTAQYTFLTGDGSAGWVETSDIMLRNNAARTIAPETNASGNGQDLTVTSGGTSNSGSLGGTLNVSGGLVTVGAGSAGSLNLIGGVNAGTGNGGGVSIGGGASTGGTDGTVTVGANIGPMGTTGVFILDKTSGDYLMSFTGATDTILVGDGVSTTFQIGNASETSYIQLSSTGFVNSDWVFAPDSAREIYIDETSSGNGDALTVTSGAAAAAGGGNGGALVLRGGAEDGTGNGGAVSLLGDSAASSGDGGSASVRSGGTATGTAGAVNVYAGAVTGAGTVADVRIYGSQYSGTSDPGNVSFGYGSTYTGIDFIPGTLVQDSDSLSQGSRVVSNVYWQYKSDGHVLTQETPYTDTTVGGGLTVSGGAAATHAEGGVGLFRGGAGGSSNDAVAAGAGGTAELNSGIGGANTSSGDAGAGGDVTLTASIGGAASGAGDGGDGGSIVLTPGQGGNGTASGLFGWVTLGNSAEDANYLLFDGTGTTQPTTDPGSASDGAGFRVSSAGVMQYKNDGDGSWKTFASTVSSIDDYIQVGKLGQLSDEADGYLLANFTEASTRNMPGYVVNAATGTLQNLYLSSRTKPAGSDTVDVTVLVNGTFTGITVTLDNATTTNTDSRYYEVDSVNDWSVSRGDSVDVYFDSTSDAVYDIIISLELAG